ncbi:dihydrofolate reductase [Microbacterium trichothecenolyticum]|uniref:dihydrofolate reductase family protein n=1 Tax=Microbacterium trichothecenolyticum TaxID=69370 RepID=UPI0028553837|nr:dihydrofolate reductase family protein [Microbacterium trichothecenolyticum]MDR7187049.1 dihydrofolate reductase [Microbacterium trichothecenolyticum]
MGSLIYFNSASLDGYIAGPDGRWDWATPDAEVHSFVNKLVAPAKTHLYGRRVYEVMKAWEDFPLDDLPPAEREFALQWRDLDKVVYSSTLDSVTTRRTELRRSFEPDGVRRMTDASATPIAIGGGRLASAAAHAGILDEVHTVIAPAVVGGGIRFLDEGLRLDLELIDERRFANGSVYLGYRVRR